MIDWITIAIEMSILAFCGLLYYLFQSRKIKGYQHSERTEAYALWIYDYHHYLDEIKDSPDYSTLNGFVKEIEAVDLESQDERSILIQKVPAPMDKELKSRLLDILKD